jgi:hypothetical protein
MPITTIAREEAATDVAGIRPRRTNSSPMMRSITVYRAAHACIAAALMTACAGSQTPVNAVPPAPPAQPGARGALLYVSDTVSGDVYVFSYPKGKLQQTLTGFADPAGECVDANGDVFIANTGGYNIVEYAHGGSSPIATLKDDGYFPVGCSVDPTTGDLAVTNFSTTGSAPGDVVIYKKAKHPKRHYVDRSINQMLLCGYDSSGNLFVDGMTQSYGAAVAELAHGGKRLRDIVLDRTIYSPGAVQWDGTHVAIGDQMPNTIYQFRIKNGKATTVGSTQLGGAAMVFQFWIDGTRVVGPDSGAGDVGIWSYPKGGSALKTIGGVYVPLGAAVSN